MDSINLLESVKKVAQVVVAVIEIFEEDNA